MVSGFGEGWGTIGARDRGTGEGDDDAGHVVEDLAGEPEGAPPRKTQLTVELDRAKGEGKAASREAGPFGPAVDEVEEMREAFVGLPEDPGVAGYVEPGLKFDGVEGDGRVGGHVGHPVPTPGIARQHDFIVAVPVVGGLDGAKAARPAPGHGEPDDEAVFEDVGEGCGEGGHGLLGSAEVTVCRCRGQWPAISPVYLNDFFDYLAKLSHHLLSVVAMAAAVYQTGNASDVTVIDIRPFNNFLVPVTVIHLRISKMTVVTGRRPSS